MTRRKKSGKNNPNNAIPRPMSDPLCNPVEKFTHPPVEPVPEPPSPPPPPVSYPTYPPVSPPTSTFPMVPALPLPTPSTEPVSFRAMLETEVKFLIAAFLAVYIAFSIHQEMYPVHTTRGIFLRSAFAVVLLYFVIRILALEKLS